MTDHRPIIVPRRERITPTAQILGAITLVLIWLFVSGAWFPGTIRPDDRAMAGLRALYGMAIIIQIVCLYLLVCLRTYDPLVYQEGDRVYYCRPVSLGRPYEHLSASDCRAYERQSAYRLMTFRVSSLCIEDSVSGKSLVCYPQFLVKRVAEVERPA